MYINSSYLNQFLCVPNEKDWSFDRVKWGGGKVETMEPNCDDDPWMKMRVKIASVKY